MKTARCPSLSAISGTQNWGGAQGQVNGGRGNNTCFQNLQSTPSSSPALGIALAPILCQSGGSSGAQVTAVSGLGKLGKGVERVIRAQGGARAGAGPNIGFALPASNTAPRLEPQSLAV